MDSRDLFDAIYHGDVEKINTLLEAGVPPDAVNLHGESALVYAASHGRRAPFEALLAHGATLEQPPLIEAAVADDTGVLTLLLSRGTDPNASDAHGWTALMEAASWDNAAAVAVLLEYGADTSLRAGGLSAHDIALKNDSQRVLALLDGRQGQP